MCGLSSLSVGLKSSVLVKNVMQKSEKISVLPVAPLFNFKEYQLKFISVREREGFVAQGKQSEPRTQEDG